MDFSQRLLSPVEVEAGAEVGSDRFNPTGVDNPTQKINGFLIVEALLKETADLQNPQFKNWYAKRFGELGRDTVLKLASQARADAASNPAFLFSHLLKKTSIGVKI